MDSPGTKKQTTFGLFLADVDGTLLTTEKIVTSRSLAAIRSLEQAGIAFTIVSGRPPRGMSFLIQQLRLKIPSAAFDGGAFIHPDLTIEKQYVLSAATVKQVLRLAEKRKMDCWIYREGAWYIRNPEAPHVSREQSNVHFSPRIVGEFENLMDQVNKVVIVCDDRSRINAVQRELQEELGDGATSSFSQVYFIDVTPVEANKGCVVENLCRTLEIPRSSMITIGDMPNDILMFKKCGYSIAMGNAANKVKSAANYITDCNDDEGFSKAVEYFIKNRVRIQEQGTAA
jgi:Cof subfamily protein (haloacid dehalogenase superfamily)